MTIHFTRFCPFPIPSLFPLCHSSLSLSHSPKLGESKYFPLSPYFPPSFFPSLFTLFPSMFSPSIPLPSLPFQRPQIREERAFSSSPPLLHSLLFFPYPFSPSLLPLTIKAAPVSSPPSPPPQPQEHHHCLLSSLPPR